MNNRCFLSVRRPVSCMLLIILVVFLFSGCAGTGRSGVRKSQSSAGREVPGISPPGEDPPGTPGDHSASLPREEDPAAPLSPEQAARRMEDLLPAGYYPVIREGRPYYLSRDADGNGREDFFLLAVFGGDEEIPREIREAEVLKNPGRLYFGESPALEFWVFVFYQIRGGLVPGPSFSLGARQVLMDMVFRDMGGNGAPGILSVAFRSAPGTEEEWLIISPGGFSRFSVRETLSSRYLFQDFTGSGAADLLIQERVIEEGLGRETLLFWYSWDGEQFAEVRSSNVVRNLKQFFSLLREAALESRWDRVVEEAAPEVFAEYRNRGLSREEILGKLFRPLAAGGPELTELDLEDLVFPGVTENPFVIKAGGNPRYTFTLAARDGAAGLVFFKSIVEMDLDPHARRQFTLLPVE